jgi:hypothetical protein
MKQFRFLAVLLLVSSIHIGLALADPDEQTGREALREGTRTQSLPLTGQLLERIETQVYLKDDADKAEIQLFLGEKGREKEFLWPSEVRSGTNIIVWDAFDHKLMPTSLQIGLVNDYDDDTDLQANVTTRVYYAN